MRRSYIKAENIEAWCPKHIADPSHVCKDKLMTVSYVDRPNWIKKLFGAKDEYGTVQFLHYDFEWYFYPELSLVNIDLFCDLNHKMNQFKIIKKMDKIVFEVD